MSLLLVVIDEAIATWSCSHQLRICREQLFHGSRAQHLPLSQTNRSLIETLVASVNTIYTRSSGEAADRLFFPALITPRQAAGAYVTA